MLDSIIDDKGSCILRMLDFFLTETQFRKGIQQYLKRWYYKATVEDDLWDSFPAGPHMVLPNITLREAMQSWTMQSGFPVVTVIRDYSTGNVTISQQRFLEQHQTDSSVWYIPLNYIWKGHDKPTKMWFIHKAITAPLFPRATQNDWLLINVDQTGFYRVNYDLKNWELLRRQLEDDPLKIPPGNRAQLIDDAFELAENELLSYEIPMKLLKYLPFGERHYVPWASAISNLELLDTVLHNTPYNGNYQNFLIDLIRPIYDNLFPGNGIVDYRKDSLNNKKLKKLILKTACTARYEPCLEWALSLYATWMKNSSAKNPYVIILLNIIQIK